MEIKKINKNLLVSLVEFNMLNILEKKQLDWMLNKREVAIFI